MNRYACMIRAVNVGGRRKMRMAELRDLCGRLGLADVQTYLQSGNLIAGTSLGPEAVSRLLVDGICSAFGYSEVQVFVRTAEQLGALIDANPFLDGRRDKTKLHATFLASPPRPDALGALDPSRYAPDEFSLGSQVVYVHCPGGYGRTKLNNGFFERKLRQPATTRNWKTVCTLAELT